MNNSVRRCPLCNGEKSRQSFPWAIDFRGQVYRYYRCSSCGSVFLNPLPTPQSFVSIYARSGYHDLHYSGVDISSYQTSAELLSNYLSPGASVCDYGCGSGYFLNALKALSFQATGVEFNREVASLASVRTGCYVYDVEAFYSQNPLPIYDAIHLGDVLEHLPDPTKILQQLLKCLKPEGGLFFIEGPLEINASPVYWTSLLFGHLKHLMCPSFAGPGEPTHLFRVSGVQQLKFLRSVCPAGKLLKWEIYETGWPYTGGNFIKRFVSLIALALGGRSFGAITFGNRFRAIISIENNKLHYEALSE